jgi:hypothetical protein
VRAVDQAGAFVEARDEYFFDAERLDASAREHDVGDGIERADFVERDFFRRDAVDFSLGNRDALENGERVFFYKIGEVAFLDERADFRVVASVFVMMVLVFVVVLVLVFVFIVIVTAAFFAVLVMMFMPVLVRVLMFMAVMMMLLVVLVFVLVLFVRVRRALVDTEFYALDILALLALEVHVKVADVELGEFPLERGGFHAEVGERADGHVAADAADAVEE